MKITMHHRWLAWLVSLSTALAAEMLPLCPTNPQYFPQKLPMHCRMPRSVDEASPDLPQFPTLPPFPETYFQSLPSDKQPPPIPIPIPPFPGMPGAMPMPGPMGGLMPGPMGGPMPGMPGGMPMSMPMPVPMVGGPPHKLPVIVMPFYSQDHSIKNPRTEKPKNKHREKKKPRKKKKIHHSTETESSSCEESSESDHSDTNSSSEHGFWKGRRNARKKMSRRSNRPHTHRMKRKELKKKNDLLTPILQYVTKDGYVIFEKKISKGEAKDWLKEFKPQSEMTEIKEVAHEVTPETKPEEKSQEYKFDPKSAEDFFKIDEEEKRLKTKEINKISMEPSNEPAHIEDTTRKGKRKHQRLKFNPLITTKE